MVEKKRTNRREKVLAQLKSAGALDPKNAAHETKEKFTLESIDRIQREISETRRRIYQLAARCADRYIRTYSFIQDADTNTFPVANPLHDGAVFALRNVRITEASTRTLLSEGILRHASSDGAHIHKIGEALQKKLNGLRNIETQIDAQLTSDTQTNEKFATPQTIADVEPASLLSLLYSELLLLVQGIQSNVDLSEFGLSAEIRTMLNVGNGNDMALEIIFDPSYTTIESTTQTIDAAIEAQLQYPNSALNQVLQIIEKLRKVNIVEVQLAVMQPDRHLHNDENITKLVRRYPRQADK